MPSIPSIFTDLATSAITSKLTGNNNNNNRNTHPQQGITGGLTIGSAIDKISSVISTRASPKSPQPNSSSGNLSVGSYNYQPSPQPQQQQQPMSGYPGYPPSSQQSYGSGAYQQPGYPGDYNQPSSGYPQQPQPPIGFNIDGGGSYGNQQPPYPMNQPSAGYPMPPSAYPPGGGGSPYPSGGGSSYQPNVGGAPPYPQSPMMGSSYGLGGGAGSGQSYGGYPPPQQQQQPSSNVYPTSAVDSVNRHYGGGPTAPPQQQPYGGGNSAYGPIMLSRPSVRPNASFNANQSAELLRKAMKGFGCDKNKVIMALCTISNWQRQEVSRAFKTMYGKDLIDNLKSELSGDFEHLILALMEPPARYDAHQLHKAMAGLGTRESLLIEIMTTRTNGQILELKNAYRQMYGSDLEHDLIGETSGHFKRLLVSLCSGGRDESTHVDPLKANQDARNLYRAGEQRLGTDESAFNAILASQNFHQLRLVFDEYHKHTGHPIEQAIENEFSGDTRKGFMAVVKSARSRPAYFAELLHESMRGMGTRDSDLIRVVVTRAEIDMVDVREEYQRLYHTPLENAIASDCSGAYKDGLIQLVKGNQ